MNSPKDFVLKMNNNEKIKILMFLCPFHNCRNSNSISKKRIMEIPIEIVAKGSFGVVVKLYSKSKDEHSAAKIQSVPKSMEDKEYKILSELSEIKSTPCTLRVYGCNRTNELSEIMANVSGFKRNTKDDNSIWQIVKMELIRGPSLLDYLHAHSTMRKPLNVDEIKSISFHLFWALNSAQKEMGLKHRDLKLENVMLRIKHEIHQYGKKKWTVEGKIPVIIDCNLSTSNTTPCDRDWRCGTISYMPPGKLYKIRKNAKEEKYEHDSWSLGIMLISMCLTGHSFIRSYPSFPKTQVFDVARYETIFQLKIPHEITFKRLFEKELPSYNWTTVRTAIGLSLFQESIGNGPFPGVPSSHFDAVQMNRMSSEVWPEFNQTKLANVMIKNWKFIKSTISHEQILIQDCVSLISSRIGMDAISLLKNLMKWIPNQRLETKNILNQKFYDSLAKIDTCNQITEKWTLSHENICSWCSNPAYKRCSRCKIVFFCDHECMKMAWPTHSLNCQ